MTGAGRSRWSRRFIILSAAFLVVWRFGALVGISRRVEVTIALFGFVFHVVFGMAYLLVPSYFGTILATDRVPAAHLAVSVSGTVLLTAGSLLDIPASVESTVESAGVLLWCAGIVAFLAALLWSIRDPLLGGETGTSSHRSDHEWVDRYANRFIPVSFAYLAAGSYELLARVSPLPGLTDGYMPRVTHLLAAGFVVLLVFTLGVRLAPRFLGVPAPKVPTGIVLLTGAVGPALIAFGLTSRSVLVAGALAEAVAFVGFTAVYLVIYLRSDRRRVGSGSILVGTVSGVFGVAIGVTVAVGPLFGLQPFSLGMVQTHLQLNLFGFLGLVIVGFAVQFYPPTAGRFRGANERTARIVIGTLAVGLGTVAVGRVLSQSSFVTLGNGLALVGAVGYGYLLTRLLVEIGSRRAN
ncbi:hypothetical protein E6P09_17400 (plasmid) [Haloferax mediterranei ATCC 33500]|uniref:Uncharacterized protein n=1 Tax=Haloferax mediterranei (strain ATCC 33500 / DSM 1411 / JCM 8866 / NBRC 14739 / NCIMB 2177 / R-4) TaxID=523841 RepID=I3R9M1_HALMT|nr:hypothetical protein [Haloferax mediterranei]AFK20931.1 hypothetical protein HFX_5096 [Haloferax mediterranei ATCC 33500]AHZ24201.1 hypothetical protein BM92_18540 [Haloferax mediterranei ATCC 33500]EMA05280.1 hypothetical protein C439_00735 [Haloferax mediterranei ATCC 33500]MDX5989918.1 hypothetical protein [Haloferax mediterranei ATCC 33500]QCQ77110.1 hypothetical protein E6P09_17400 [Haloferax mediterranei ATCC 33500]